MLSTLGEQRFEKQPGICKRLLQVLGGDIAVNGALSLSAGTLADAGFTATVKGDAANDATHTGTGKIVLAQDTAAHVLSGGGSYGNLDLSDTNGAALNLTNLTVNGSLTFTKGLITTTTNKVIMGPTGSVTRASGHVVGFLQKPVTNAPAVTNTFEIGDAAQYAPVSVVVSNVATAGNLIASWYPTP